MSPASIVEPQVQGNRGAVGGLTNAATLAASFEPTASGNQVHASWSAQLAFETSRLTFPEGDRQEELEDTGEEDRTDGNSPIQSVLSIQSSPSTKSVQSLSQPAFLLSGALSTLTLGRRDALLVGPVPRGNGTENVSDRSPARTRFDPAFHGRSILSSPPHAGTRIAALSAPANLTLSSGQPSVAGMQCPTPALLPIPLESRIQASGQTLDPGPTQIPLEASAEADVGQTGPANPVGFPVRLVRSAQTGMPLPAGTRSAAVVANSSPATPHSAASSSLRLAQSEGNQVQSRPQSPANATLRDLASAGATSGRSSAIPTASADSALQAQTDSPASERPVSAPPEAVMPLGPIAAAIGHSHSRPTPSLKAQSSVAPVPFDATPVPATNLAGAGFADLKGEGADQQTGSVGRPLFQLDTIAQPTVLLLQSGLENSPPSSAPLPSGSSLQTSSRNEFAAIPKLVAAPQPMLSDRATLHEPSAEFNPEAALSQPASANPERTNSANSTNAKWPDRAVRAEGLEVTLAPVDGAFSADQARSGSAAESKPVLEALESVPVWQAGRSQAVDLPEPKSLEDKIPDPESRRVETALPVTPNCGQINLSAGTLAPPALTALADPKVSDSSRIAWGKPGPAKNPAMLSAANLSAREMQAHDPNISHASAPVLTELPVPAFPGTREASDRSGGISAASRNPFPAMDTTPGGSNGFAGSGGDWSGRERDGVHAGTRLEFGYQDPELGYVELQTHGTGSGVHASLVAETEKAGAALAGQMSSLASWMQDRHTPLESLTVRSPEPADRFFAAGGGADSNGERNAQQNSADSDADHYRNAAGNGADAGRQQPYASDRPASPRDASQFDAWDPAPGFDGSRLALPDGKRISIMA